MPEDDGGLCFFRERRGDMYSTILTSLCKIGQASVSLNRTVNFAQCAAHHEELNVTSGISIATWITMTNEAWVNNRGRS